MEESRTRGEIEELIRQISRDEENLVFDEFTHEDALDLGLALHSEARRRNASVTIDIRTGEQVLFHLAMNGTTPNNDRWVRRKSNTVQLIHKSSYRVGRELFLNGETLASRQFLDMAEYADHGGSFPLNLRGYGVVGAITVSGLPHEEDHQLVVGVLKAFLDRE